MARAVTLWSDGGGVGKTTVAINTASALGRAGKDVLCVDLDPQLGGLTNQAGFPSLLEHEEYNITEALLNRNKSLNDIVISGDEMELDFDFIPAHTSLSKFGERVIASNTAGNNATILRWEMNEAGFFDEYDAILVDVPSGRSLIAANALVATRNVVLPTELSRKGRRSVAGLKQYLEELAHGMERSGATIDFGIIAVVPNRAGDARGDKRSREKYREMDAPIAPFEIRTRDALMKDCQDERLTIFEFAESPETRDVRDHEQETLQKFEKLAQIVMAGSVDAVETEVKA